MQTTLQEKEKNKNQIISLVLVVLSIIVGFFFTMDQGYSYIEKKDTLETTQKESAEKRGTLEKLQTMTKNIANDTELQKDIERYASDFREDTILDNLFTPLNSGISIANIALSKGDKTPNGLSLANISLSIKAQNISALNSFLDYLTNNAAAKKSYIIKNLNFPLDTTKDEAIPVSLELGMYYFE